MNPVRRRLRLGAIDLVQQEKLAYPFRSHPAGTACRPFQVVRRIVAGEPHYFSSAVPEFSFNG